VQLFFVYYSKLWAIIFARAARQILSAKPVDGEGAAA